MLPRRRWLARRSSPPGLGACFPLPQSNNHHDTAARMVRARTCRQSASRRCSGMSEQRSAGTAHRHRGQNPAVSSTRLEIKPCLITLDHSKDGARAAASPRCAARRRAGGALTAAMGSSRAERRKCQWAVLGRVGSCTRIQFPPVLGWACSTALLLEALRCSGNDDLQINEAEARGLGSARRQGMRPGCRRASMRRGTGPRSAIEPCGSGSIAGRLVTLGQKTRARKMVAAAPRWA